MLVVLCLERISHDELTLCWDGLGLSFVATGDVTSPMLGELDSSKSPSTSWLVHSGPRGMNTSLNWGDVRSSGYTSFNI